MSAVFGLTLADHSILFRYFGDELVRGCTKVTGTLEEE